jgi:NAD-dependent dihydropyrimidine dehydrogenase PreA subunit
MTGPQNSRTTLTVVISAGQSRNPEKRQLEDEIATLASEMAGVNVLRVPHLYDLPKGSQTYQALKAIDGNLVVLCWLFDRATHWILDRNGVRGQVGEVHLHEEVDEDEAEQAVSEDAEDRVIDSQPRPSRSIYCIDYRASNRPDDYREEILRIQTLHARDPLAELQQRFENPTNDTYVGAPSLAASAIAISSVENSSASLFGASSVVAIDEHPGRRWYPVIDFSRCTNCMECIDFCLFGVYGVDTLETIVVEQADNCRKGCPACSRVCPQNAIIFPQHKTPAIAGAPVDASGMKIDLSKLFGAPESDEDAAAVAARERDEQLILAGRAAVGLSTGIPERLAETSQAENKSDELDSLIDQLDSLDL